MRNQVMQLEYLIEHAQDGDCGCVQCKRYMRAKAVLMEVFGEAPLSAFMKKTSSPSGK